MVTVRRISFKLQAPSCNQSKTSIKTQLLFLYKLLVVVLFLVLYATGSLVLVIIVIFMDTCR